MALYSNEELSNILQTLVNGENKPTKVRSLVKKACNRLEKNNATYENLLLLFRGKPETGLIKPKNAWQLFLAEFREGIKDTIAGSEQTKRASAAWRSMSDSAKEQYIIEAENQSSKYKLAKEALIGEKPIRPRGRPRKNIVVNLSDNDE